jgi:hypothetical protein
MSARAALGALGLAALLAGACGGGKPAEEPYEGNVRCEYEVRGRAYSYGSAGDPNPVEYRCETVATPPVERPAVPPDVAPDPSAPRTVIEEGAD